MRWTLLSAAAVIALAVGCAREPATIPSAPAKGAGAKMDEVVQTIKLTGFDPEGEPVIRVMGDGSLYVVFNFMPPSFVPEDEGLGPFADFDKQLERAARAPVVWDDREVFVISQPRADTVERVRKFIEDYRSK